MDYDDPQIEAGWLAEQRGAVDAYLDEQGVQQ
jgi:hypothetical protein